LNSNDPGIHYQLFTTYTRLRRREEAAVSLATFRRLEDERKRAPARPGTQNADAAAAGDAPAPAPALPRSVTETVKTPPPQD
jgi:hypothetical protein